ncbi:MAG: sulfatase-like hydrolase/transferase, partial [Acidobacteriota bacterium]
MDSPRRRAGSSATLVLMALASLAFGCSESEVPSLGDSGSASQRLSEAKPPNLLVVLYDDLDLIGDLGPFGGDPAEVQTPFSDLLAETGRRFDHFYVNAPVCSPTRMALLTGHYPTRYGFTWATEETSRRGLPTVTPTLPRLLKERGYLTGAFGKWHIGSSQDALLPQGVGFDRAAINCTFTNFGRSPANPDPADAAIGYREARFCDRPGRPLADSGRSFATTYTVDKALELITEALDATPGEPPGPGARPFYAQVWLHAPHTPLTCPPGAVDCPTCDPEEDCDARQKRRIHHAMISHAESQLLRLHRDLNARGVWGETLVILASDNGGVGGWHEPSTDLRGAKGSLYERGLRTPLLVSGPGVDVGVVDEVVAGVDLLPTLVELLDLSTDPTHSERASGPTFAGRSFAASLRNGPAKAPAPDLVGDAYFWELRPRAAPDRHTLAGRWLQLAVQRRINGRLYKLVKTDFYAGGDE